MNPAIYAIAGTESVMASAVANALSCGGIMKHSLFRITLLAAAVISCRGAAPLTAPPTSESLAVSVQTRSATAGESIPTVRISGEAGAVTVKVTRAAMCGTLVNAGVSRGANALAVVAHVSTNPAADCIAVSPVSWVVDYAGTITGVAAGSYTVRVFEGAGDNEPRLIGSASVSVSKPAT